MFARQKQPFANPLFTQVSMALENACLYSWERKRTPAMEGHEYDCPADDSGSGIAGESLPAQPAF